MGELASNLQLNISQCKFKRDFSREKETKHVRTLKTLDLRVHPGRDLRVRSTD